MAIDAFPSPGVIIPGNDPNARQQGAYEGMSLRDYFAAKAMQAFIAKTDTDYFSDVVHEIRGGMNVSVAAYVVADAMLAEREKK